MPSVNKTDCSADELRLLFLAEVRRLREQHSAALRPELRRQREMEMRRSRERNCDRPERPNGNQETCGPVLVFAARRGR